MTNRIQEIKMVLEELKDERSYLIDELDDFMNSNPTWDEIEKFEDLEYKIEELTYEIEGTIEYLNGLKQGNPNSLEFVGMNQNDFI